MVVSFPNQNRVTRFWGGVSVTHHFFGADFTNYMSMMWSRNLSSKLLVDGRNPAPPGMHMG